MQNIMNFIRLNGTPASVSPGELITSKSHDIYLCHLLESGTGVIYSDIHSRSTGIVNGPSVVGLNQILYPEQGLALKMIHPSTVYSIPAQELSAMIQQNNLWSVLAFHLSELIYELHNKNHKSKMVDTTAIVYSALQSLHKESEEVRMAHTAKGYVVDITGLSSSTVSRALDVFKKQRRIEVYNGVLIRLHECVASPQ